MIIKCPHCSTGYNIPDNMVEDKPRKMRCSRCSQIFTITRRQEESPLGYEEYTGRQNLPEEFAFLREAPNEYEEYTGQQNLPEEFAFLRETPDESEAAPHTEHPGLDQPEESEAIQQPTPTAAQATAPPVQHQPAVAEIYAGTSAWETEAPVELANYTIDGASQPAPTSQLVGKIMTATVVLIVAFLLFVAWRNDWSIAFADLPAQVAFAFSGNSADAISPQAKYLETTVAEKHIVIADNKVSYLVVNGTVFNGGNAGRSQVILRGRLLDHSGTIRSEARGPCGKIIDDTVIKATAKGAIGGHFRGGNALHNCSIRPEEDTVFQLIFEDVPQDYSSDYSVDVVAVAATDYSPG